MIASRPFGTMFQWAGTAATQTSIVRPAGAFAAADDAKANTPSPMTHASAHGRPRTRCEASELR
jgi:hypothetical protein